LNSSRGKEQKMYSMMYSLLSHWCDILHRKCIVWILLHFLTFFYLPPQLGIFLPLGIHMLNTSFLKLNKLLLHFHLHLKHSDYVSLRFFYFSCSNHLSSCRYHKAFICLCLCLKQTPTAFSFAFVLT